MRMMKKSGCLLLCVVLFLSMVSMAGCQKAPEGPLCRCLCFGTGEKTMVVVPGLTVGYVTDNAAAIEAAFADFTEEFTVYLFDVRDDVPENYTISAMGEDLAESMKRLGLKDAYLYGCSMGGMECIYVAGTYPELAAKAVLASSACQANETSEAVIGNWISLAKAGKKAELTADMGQKIYSAAVYAANEQAFADMAAGMTDEALTRFVNTAGVIPGLDLTEKAAAIRCPVLVLGSEGDCVLTGEASRVLAEMTGGELYLYGPDAPHAVYDEAPDFRSRVLAFFEGVPYAPADPEPIPEEDGTVSVETAITLDTKYGSVNTVLTQEEFIAAGFCLGDSVDVTFDNGLTLTDVPFYNGYYVKNGEPIVVSYPGYANVGIAYNNMGIWEQEGLKEGDTVTIRRNTPGKYAAVQDTLGQAYSFVREDYDSDIRFVNFRALSGGSLKENFLFRGASPVDNSRGRAAYTDKLLSDYGIRTIIDLADTEEDVANFRAKEDFSSDYAASLIDSGNAAMLGLGVSYMTESYQQALISGLRFMMQNEGPVYIHCMEGKDRTGFVCILLEALAGATYEQMRADYMTTYYNYYSVTSDLTPEKYTAISNLYFDAFMSYLIGSDAVEIMMDSDYTEAAAAYLMQGGMTAEEIAQLKAFITE